LSASCKLTLLWLRQRSS